MPHWIDHIPNQVGMQILDWLFNNPGGTPRQFWEATEGAADRPSFDRVAWRFAQLERLGFVEVQRKGDYRHYTTAMSREEFDERCLKIIIENAFSGDRERLRAALDRLSTKGRPKRK